MSIRCSVDNQGRRLLHHAASNGMLEVVRLLVSAQNSTLNALDADLNTPLHLAYAAGFEQVCHALVDLGADYRYEQ